MFNVEFYVTNKNNEYLLCFNHHDVLIACGDATEWIKNRFFTTFCDLTQKIRKTLTNS